MEKNRKQKRDFFDSMRQLETRLLNFERERNGIIFAKKGEFKKEASLLEEYEILLSFQRKAEKQDILQKLQKIKANVGKLQKTLVTVKATPKYVEKLKESMEDIEHSITSFKEKQRRVYEQLLSEEEALYQETNSFKRKLESWSRTDIKDTVIPDKSKPFLANQSASVPAAVAALECYLQSSGGHTGGWDDYDHQLFQKFHAKHRNPKKLIEALTLKLPARSQQDIVEHIEWYSKYVILLEDKKEAIAEWKEAKMTQRTEMLKNVQEDSNTVKDGLSAKEKQQYAKKKEDQLKRIQEWKEKQAKDKLREEEERKLREEKKLGNLEKEKKKRLEVRQQVGEYVRQRETEKKQYQALKEAQKEEELVQRRLANREIEKYRQRDSEVAKGKMERMAKEERQQKEKASRLERLKAQVEVSVPSDPSRLFKLTAGWEERKKQEKADSGVFISARNIPKRAIPSWRQV